MSKHLLAVVLVFATVSASCGSGDDTSSESIVPSTTTTPADATTTTDATTQTTGAPPTEPVELTASFRGVTAEAIKVGVLSFDWDGLAALGVDFGRSNSGDLYVAAIESLNDRGGVHGRLLEPVLAEFLPVGATEADAACVELTEDEMVFVVIGTSLNDQILCFTELHETAAIVASGITPERQSRARAPYAAVVEASEPRAARFVELVAATGLFDDTTIGVTGAVDVSITAFQTVVDALNDAGIVPVEGLVGGNASDLAASAREQALIYQRLDDEGVDVTISTSGVPLTMANAFDAGYESPQWVLSTIMTALGLSDAGVPLEYLDGAIGVVDTLIGTSAQPSLGDDPLIAACVDDLVGRSGHEVYFSLDVETNDLSAALFACSNVAILEQALLNAGPDLTNESLQAGLEAIGPIELPGYRNASLGPGDMGAAKGLSLVEFDAASGIWNLLDE